MTPAADSSRRLQRLQQILTDSKAALNSTSGQDADPAEFHLGSVPLERISRLASALTQEVESDIDEVDWLATRLLLNDYATAVAHLRVAARLADQRVAAAAVPVQEARLCIRQREKRTKAAGRKTT